MLQLIDLFFIIAFIFESIYIYLISIEKENEKEKIEQKLREEVELNLSLTNQYFQLEQKYHELLKKTEVKHANHSGQ